MYTRKDPRLSKKIKKEISLLQEMQSYRKEVLKELRKACKNRDMKRIKYIFNQMKRIKKQLDKLGTLISLDREIKNKT